MMKGTALVYSSHNRGELIHNHLIVQRALAGNKRILFIPMSEGIQNGSEMERQEFSYGTFRWYFSFYDRYGLKYMPFYWSSGMSKQDVDVLWDHLYNDEVVILGGGGSVTGLERFKQLGAVFDDEPGKFGRLLHERQQRGLLTVGFSAGADQLCERLFRESMGKHHGDNDAFGLVRNTLVTLHHEPYRDGDLVNAARQYGHCMVFGLPNDSGLNTHQGVLPSGNWFQIIQFVIDNTWDIPEEQFHIKTKQGAKITHFSHHGWHWAFDGGDVMVRIQSPDNRFHEAWMTQGGRMMHYWTRQPSRYHGVGQLLAAH